MIRVCSWMALMLFLGTGACTQRTDPPADEALASAASAGDLEENAADACPSVEFEEFLTAFAENPAQQEKFTRFPLERLSVLNEGVEEPQPVEEVVSRSEARFPLLPSAEERQEQQLQLEVSSEGERRRLVRIWEPDTDAQAMYIFVQDGGCWRLVRIEDWSL